MGTAAKEATPPNGNGPGANSSSLRWRSREGELTLFVIGQVNDTGMRNPPCVMRHFAKRNCHPAREQDAPSSYLTGCRAVPAIISSKLLNQNFEVWVRSLGDNNRHTDILRLYRRRHTDTHSCRIGSLNVVPPGFHLVMIITQ